MQGEVRGEEIRPPPCASPSALPAMAQQGAIAPGDHGPGVPQQGLDGMARRSVLPLLAVLAGEAEDDLRDLALGRAIAVAVEALQHPAQSQALLRRQPCVGRDRAAMERGQQPGQGFEAIEARAVERNDRGQRLAEADARLDVELETLAVAEIKEKDILAIAADVRGRRDRGCRFGADREGGGRRRQEEGAGVVFGQPGDPSFSRRRLWIDGEIAAPNVAGFSRSGSAGRLSARAAPENPDHRPRCGEATPTPDRMRSCRRRAHSHRRIASRLHRVSRRSSLCCRVFCERQDG